MTADDIERTVPIVMTSVTQTLALKLSEEVNKLHNALNDMNALRNFGEFNRLVQDMQASVRAIDVLEASDKAKTFHSTDLRKADEAIPKFLRNQTSEDDLSGDEDPSMP